MNCVECHRPFRWEAPGQNGITQGWMRHHENGPNGARCADRGACHRAAAELQPSLFGPENHTSPAAGDDEGR